MLQKLELKRGISAPGRDLELPQVFLDPVCRASQIYYVRTALALVLERRGRLNLLSLRQRQDQLSCDHTMSRSAMTSERNEVHLGDLEW